MTSEQQEQPNQNPTIGSEPEEKPRNKMTNQELQKALTEANEREAAMAVQLEDERLERQMAESKRDAAIRQLEENPAPITPVGDQREHKGDNPKATRRQMSQGKRLDASLYELEYPDKKLFWVNDMNGDVHRWINAGADCVPVKENANRTFEGVTDAHESKWVRAVGGDDGMGGFHWVYLLMMEPDRYDEVELAPLRARQADIKAAMAAGANQSDEAESANVKAYAPHLPTGGRGFQQIQNHMTGRG